MNNYPENKNNDLREEFKPIARSYRFYKRICLSIQIFICSSFFIFFLICSVEGKLNIDHPSISLALSMLIFGLIVGLLSLYASYKLARIKCPGCKNSVSNRQCLGEYCPNCKRNWITNNFYDWNCSSCERIVVRGKHGYGRYTSITFVPMSFRYCTHCGSHLCDKFL